MSITESYYCSEVVPRCQYIARSGKLDEVLAQAVRHITEKHHVREITPEIAEVVRKAVHPTLAEPCETQGHGERGARHVSNYGG